MIEQLGQVPIFHKASPAELKQLAGIAKKESFDAGTVVFFQGDRADKLYVIISGMTKVYQQSDDGKENTLGMLGPGEIVGELTVLGGGERTATVEATQDTEMLSILHRDFHDLATKNVSILWGVVEVLCDRLRSLSERAQMIANEDVPYRVIHSLIELVDKQGKPDEGNGVIVTTTPTDIGRMAGTDKQDVARVLKKLNGRGLVELGGGDDIIVPDKRALERALEYAREWF